MTPSRASQIDVHYRRDELAALIEGLLPSTSRRVEAAALYAAMCLFWGFVLFVMLDALP